jgi:hypothetical protein
MWFEHRPLLDTPVSLFHTTCLTKLLTGVCDRIAMRTVSKPRLRALEPDQFPYLSCVHVLCRYYNGCDGMGQTCALRLSRL